MKKRIIIIAIAVLLIILTACESKVTDPSPSRPTPSDPLGEVTRPGEVAMPGGPLPDRGYESLKAPERYYPGQVYEFIPSDSYGRILPYIGGYLDGMMGTQSELVGICDEKGKIICDPGYNTVEIIENYGHKLYAFVKYEERYIDFECEQFYMTTLISIDGSWVGTFERVIWEESSPDEFTPPYESNYGHSRAFQWRAAKKYEYITAKRGDRWGVLDWDGSTLLPFRYAEPVCFSEGVAAVLSRDGATYNFIDITGQTVLGPYQAPPMAVNEWDHYSDIPLTDKIIFHEGYAKFYRDGKYGIIDRSGRIVFPATFDFITCIDSGIAMFLSFSVEYPEQSPDLPLGVINDSGVVIVGPSDYDHRHHYFNPQNMDGEVILQRFDREIGEKVAYDGTKTPYVNQDQITFGEDYYTIGSSNTRLPMRDYNVDYVNDDLLIVFDLHKGTWQLYNNYGVPVSQENPGKQLIGSGKENNEYILIDASELGEWTWPPPMSIYDLNGNPLLDGIYNTIIQIEDMFMVRGNTTAGLMDKNGAYIVQVSIAAYGAD